MIEIEIGSTADVGFSGERGIGLTPDYVGLDGGGKADAATILCNDEAFYYFHVVKLLHDADCEILFEIQFERDEFVGVVDVGDIVFVNGPICEVIIASDFVETSACLVDVVSSEDFLRVRAIQQRLNMAFPFIPIGR